MKYHHDQWVLDDGLDCFPCGCQDSDGNTVWSMDHKKCATL